MNGQCLIITGMHRSHTSLLTQCIHQAGLHLGHQLLDATKYNAQGHFEHEQIVALHEELINAYQLRSKWNGINNKALQKVRFDKNQNEVAENIIRKLSVNSDTYGWKDPRACLFLNDWLRIIPDAKFLFIVRHPTQCIESLMKRSYSKRTWKTGPFLSNAILNLWTSYNTCILEFIKSHQHNCALVNSSDLQNPKILNNKLNDQIIEKWGYNLKTIDVNQNYNPRLVTSRSPSWSVRYMYTLRKDVQILYNHLLELCL